MFFFAAQIFCACEADFSAEKKPSEENPSSLTIVNWNVETFFDAEKEGVEYSEFQKSSWTREKYLVRLERLCKAISSLDADLYVFEEIENESVIFDISNQLAANSWNSKKNWTYSCFAKPFGTAIGCGIISRYEIASFKTHFIDIRTQKNAQPSTRYMLEADVIQDGKKLKVFVNHWKSKSGGAEKSEIWRDWQESLLAGRLSEILEEQPSLPVFICGDFNRDITEFYTDKNTVILRNAGFGEQKSVRVNTPWLSLSGDFATPTGSYYYQEEWNRIDQMFTCGNARIVNFCVKTDGEWASPAGIPKSYSVYNGSGYSDHLPLFCSIVF